MLKPFRHYTGARFSVTSAGEDVLIRTPIMLVAGILFAAVLVGPTGAVQRPAENGSEEAATVVKTYCLNCHNDKARTGGLSLEGIDLTNIPKSAEPWEKAIRKVRAGMMPPPGAARPPA